MRKKSSSSWSVIQAYSSYPRCRLRRARCDRSHPHAMPMSTCERMGTRFSSATTPTHTTTISSILSSVSTANARPKTCERSQMHSSTTGSQFGLTASAHTTCTTLSKRVCDPSRCSAVHTVTRHTTAPIRSKMNESTRPQR